MFFFVPKFFFQNFFFQNFFCWFHFSAFFGLGQKIIIDMLQLFGCGTENNYLHVAAFFWTGQNNY